MVVPSSSPGHEPESEAKPITTILAVRKDGQVAIGGDGQVTLGHTIVKHQARKVRKLYRGQVLAGFAGGAADAFALLEKLEKMLEEHHGHVPKAATELARLWRTDRVYRRLESQLVVVNKEHGLLVSGAGDLIEPDDGILGIGSGSMAALAAARALATHTALPPAEIVREALRLASQLCVYTNAELVVETL